MTNVPRRTFFYSNVLIPNENGCMFWIGRKDHIGYGVLWNGNKIMMAHRFSYELFINKIPNKLLCLHHCDNRNCVAPDHLFLGTQFDNMQDMKTKGRLIQPFRKLCVDQVKEIKKLILLNVHDVEISKQFHVHRDTIRHIRNGNNWSNV